MQVLITEIASLDLDAIVAALAEHHAPVFAAIRQQGAAAERERIQAVRAQLMPGHERLIESLAFDGKTTGPEAAVAVINAERAAADKRRAALASDTPPPVAADPSATGDTPPKPKAKDPQAEASRLANAITEVQAKAAAAGRPISAIQAMALVKQQA